MRQGLITVVLPVYNVEQYLDRCVDSVVNQTYNNLEILLIDDGSTDSCSQKCDKWASRDARIRVIHKDNAGLGMARNTGIEYATGEYICFFDSDDYVDNRAIERAYELAQREMAEIVIFGMQKLDHNGKVLYTVVPIPEKAVYCNEDVQRCFIPEFLGPDPVSGKNSGIPCSACTCLMSVELIRCSGWRFVSEKEIISEDIYSLLALFRDVKRIAILNEALYYYCTNESSLTQVYRKDRYAKNKYFYLQCVELCRICNYPSKVSRQCMEPFLGNTIGAMKQEALGFNNRKGAVTALRDIVNDELLQRVVREKKNDKTGLKKKMLITAIRNKWYYVCYLLLVAQNIRDKRWRFM